MEKRGLNGRLVFIDGAPEQMKAILDQLLVASTEEAFQNNILLNIYNSIYAIDAIQSISSRKVDFIVCC